MEKILLILFSILFSFHTHCFAGDTPKSFLMKMSPETHRIAVDPGFGGEETGPSSCNKGIFAKDINLAIAKTLVRKINSDLGYESFLTRETDKLVSLEERVAILNSKKTDLFISIQVNGYSDPEANGVETYSLYLYIDDEALKIARAKKDKPKDTQDINVMVADLAKNYKITESNLLANCVHNHLYQHLRGYKSEIKDRGTKNAPFYILLGAQMPSIVVQPGFITNPIECNLLESKEYQEKICVGIMEGLRAYIKENESKHSPKDERLKKQAIGEGYLKEGHD